MSDQFNTQIQELAAYTFLLQPLSAEESSKSWLTRPLNQPQAVIIKHTCTTDSTNYQKNLMKSYDINSHTL